MGLPRGILSVALVAALLLVVVLLGIPIYSLWSRGAAARAAEARDA